MKWFRHELQSRDSDQIYELIDVHGAQGYGIWWVILEECYKAEDNGFQIKATGTWFKRLSKSLNLTDWRTLIRILDTMAELGLINRVLWESQRVISVDELTDSYKSRRLPAHEWERLRQQVFNRDGRTCQYCGAKPEKLHCDHIVPLSRGGTNDLSNLTTACAACNLSKHNKTIEEWRPQ